MLQDKNYPKFHDTILGNISYIEPIVHLQIIAEQSV
jgi:hypothetical protein